MITIILILGILFVRRIQPIIIVRSLIIIILLYSLYIYNWIRGYWFRYALIIVILRGVLVVFTYIVRLIPNERFERYNLIYIFIFIVMIIGRYILYYSYNMCFISLGIWRTYIRIFVLFMVGFLLRIILIVVWLSYMNNGALRVGY